MALVSSDIFPWHQRVGCGHDCFSLAPIQVNLPKILNILPGKSNQNLFNNFTLHPFKMLVKHPLKMITFLGVIITQLVCLLEQCGRFIQESVEGYLSYSGNDY
jgi:hypothetical protein